jgi:uncharacterized protein with PIN domain
MPHTFCHCGTRIYYGEIPCPYEWRILSDVEFAKFRGLVDAEILYLAMQSFLKCPECSRLLVYWEGFAKLPTVYKPEAPLDDETGQQLPDTAICHCGTRICYGETPCPYKWQTLSDVEFDKYHGQIDAEALYRAMQSMLKCPTCGRLLVYWEGLTNPPVVYKPEAAPYDGTGKQSPDSGPV